MGGGAPKAAASSNPAGKRADNFGLGRPLPKERHSKKKHDTAQRQEEDVQIIKPTRAEDAAKEPELGLDKAPEGPEMAPETPKAQPDTTPDPPKDAPKTEGPPPRTEIPSGRADGSDGTALKKGDAPPGQDCRPARAPSTRRIK